MRYLTAVLLLLLAGVYAQPTANQVVFNLILAQRNAQDYQIHVVGTAQQGGQALTLELTLQRINALELSRLEFAQPDSLAGNIIITEKDQSKNYLALTNQVVVSKGQAGQSRINLNQLTDIRSLLSQDRAEITLLGSENIEGKGMAYVLEIKPKPSSKLQFAKAKVWVLENPWRPYRLQTFDAAGNPLNDLTFTEFQTNLGLSAQKLKALPLDAEVVNK